MQAVSGGIEVLVAVGGRLNAVERGEVSKVVLCSTPVASLGELEATVEHRETSVDAVEVGAVEGRSSAGRPTLVIAGHVDVFHVGLLGQLRFHLASTRVLESLVAHNGVGHDSGIERAHFGSFAVEGFDSGLELVERHGTGVVGFEHLRRAHSVGTREGDGVGGLGGLCGFKCCGEQLYGLGAGRQVVETDGLHRGERHLYALRRFGGVLLGFRPVLEVVFVASRQRGSEGQAEKDMFVHHGFALRVEFSRVGRQPQESYLRCLPRGE